MLWRKISIFLSLIYLPVFVCILIFTFGISGQALAQGSPDPGNNFSGDSSVKALWRFESGALGIDSKGTNNLVTSGSPTSDGTIYKEGAASGDFDTIENDFLFISDASLNAGFPFKNGGANRDISVAFWLRLDSFSALYRTHFLKGNPGYSIMIATNSTGRIELRISTDGASWNTYTHSSPLALGTWYYVAVTYQNSDGAYRIRIWDDTAQAILGSDAVGTAITDVFIGAGDLRIGTGAFINNNYNMNGKFDEIVVFNRAISTAEIDQIRRGEYGCDNHEVWGYAWSENIGLISFSCANTNPLGARVNYGVDIDESIGNLSGYAWAGGGINPDDSSSATIGWISFNASEFGTCPIGFGPCQPNVSLTTGALTGYARACTVFQSGCSGALKPLSETGGWDGWIRLSGTWVNGVALNSGVGPPSEFQGWAWGGDDSDGEAVIGWISFNRANCDSDRNGFSDGVPEGCPAAGTAIPNYAVYTGLSINIAPTAAISCTPSCTIYHTEVLVLNNDSSDPDGVPPVGNITQSEWSLSEPPAGYIVRPACVVDPILCDIAPQNFSPVGLGLAGVGDYIARLIVIDEGGLSSTATRYFSILRDATAGFMCSLSEFGPWEDCESMTTAPLDGQIVWFFDDPGLVEYSQPSQGASINSRTWQRIGDPIPFSVGNTQKTNIAASLPSMDIRLTVADTAARSASVTHTIGVSILPLPTWNEIAPF